MSRILSELEQLSSAEEFLAYFGIPFEQAQVDVARLHIMQQTGNYLRSEDLDEADLFVTCKTMLERAYADLLSSSPREARLFKVFRADKPGRTLVPLAALERRN